MIALGIAMDKLSEIHFFTSNFDTFHREKLDFFKLNQDKNSRLLM